ncbi:MAG TPA: hypothetical protein VKV36_08580 [Acidimicrobiales bacterium]|nr:hypothetical protein [Acidimicrobiales bacterium]
MSLRRRRRRRRERPRRGLVLPGVRRWRAFERRLAEGTITDAVIRLANGEEVTVERDTPVLLGPGDTIVWREDRGWGWSTGGSAGPA